MVFSSLESLTAPAILPHHLMVIYVCPSVQFQLPFQILLLIIGSRGDLSVVLPHDQLQLYF